VEGKLLDGKDIPVERESHARWGEGEFNSGEEIIRRLRVEKGWRKRLKGKR